MQESVRKEQKRSQNTLDVADFVRDVAKSSYHQLSQNGTLRSPRTQPPFAFFSNYWASSTLVPNPAYK